MEILKRIVIKEELVALTGDYRKAILLNQFLYWTERVKDFDKFINEEKIRYELEGEKNKLKLQNGWIYKTSDELSEETMLGLSKSNIRAHIKCLIENGWIDERVNPNFKWDKTMQYRVNMLKLQRDLYNIGYALEGYPLFLCDKEEVEQPEEDETNDKEDTEQDSIDCCNDNHDEDIEPRSFKTEPQSSKTEPRSFKIEPQGSEIEQQYQRLHTENNNIYIYSQSVNNQECQGDNYPDEKDGPTEINQAKEKIMAMGYPCLETEMVINSLIDITKKSGTKLIDKLTDKKIIDYAITKFKKLDKTKIKNHQAYFTSILNNSIFEYAASEIAGQEQPADAAVVPKNKFHNFDQRMKNYSGEELEDIARKKLEKKLQELEGKKRADIAEEKGEGERLKQSQTRD